MKKTFALVLAIAMVMSLAAVSFAAVSATGAKDNTQLALAGPYKYDGDKDSGAGAMLASTIQYGKAAYYQILFGGEAVETYSVIEKLKVKAKWEMGGDLVDSLNIVKKRIGAVDGKKVGEETIVNKTDMTGLTGSYAYFAEIKTKASTALSDSDIVGTLTFNMKKNKNAPTGKQFEFDDAEIDVTVNVFYETNWNDVPAYLVNDSFNGQLKPDKKYLLKFDSDEEVDLEFGLDQNEGIFTVDVSGQGKILFEFTTTANDAIVDANPAAKIFFANFNNTKFNRTGEFAYESEDFQFVYEIKDGKLVTIPSAEYDEADDTLYFNTRVLGSYVFSDVELVDAPVVADTTVDVPAEKNPTTGAAA